LAAVTSISAPLNSSLPSFVRDRMSDDVDIFDRPIWQQQSMFKIDILAVAGRAVDRPFA